MILIGLQSISCSSSDKYKITDHYNGKNFYNPGTKDEPKSIFTVLKWKIFADSSVWPDKVDPPYKLGLPIPSSEKLIVTFVNHATFLIQVDNLNILTDPVWAKRVSPFSFAGPKRVHGPGVEFDKLPKIHAVLISHNHYDHMDSETIKKLEDRDSPLFIVPLANEKKMKSFGAKKITEIDWWDSVALSPEVNVTLTPARHWSSRTLWDKRESLWGSFFIESKKEKIYFSGDTGYGAHFAEIFKRLGAPTLSMLAIGAYQPRWFMKDMHMNPEDAVLAHLDLQSKKSIGMHFGTFKLSDEKFEDPVNDLEMAKKKLSVSNFTTMLPGTHIEGN